MQDYGQFKTLALCPKTNNCVSTAEEANDENHFVPTWTYNPEDGRGRRKPASKQQAMSELVEVVKNSKPDNFTPSIIKQTDDYLYVEYVSPTFGFVDDTEFYFQGDRCVADTVAITLSLEMSRYKPSSLILLCLCMHVLKHSPL